MDSKENKSGINFESLYGITEQWASDLLFYNDELRFLNHILDRYFSDMVALENLDEIRESTIRLQDLRNDCDKISEDIKIHFGELTKCIDHPELAPKSIQGNHDRLGKEYLEFVEKSKRIKREFFTITEHVLAAKKEKSN